MFKTKTQKRLEALERSLITMPHTITVNHGSLIGLTALVNVEEGMSTDTLHDIIAQRLVNSIKDHIEYRFEKDGSESRLIGTIYIRA